MDEKNASGTQSSSTGSSGTAGASGAARSAYDQGQRFVRRVGERYPQARRYYERGTRTVGSQVAEAPLVSMLAVGAVGYALGWAIHAGQSSDRARGRSRRDYPGYRSGKPLIESDRVEGTAVYDLDGNRIGTVERLMIEKIGGRVAYAVMSFGGFLGVGAEEYAIPWRKLDYDTSLEGYRTDITEEQLRNAPSLSSKRDEDWSDRELERALHDHYRVSYYWVSP